MPSPPPENATRRPMELDLVKSLWKSIGTRLESQRDRNYEQISDYPTPIAGCDEQFNYLLEQRDMIARELVRMDEVSEACLTRTERMELIDAFIRSSSCIDDEAARKIRSCLTEGIAELET